MQHWTFTRDADGLARLTLDRAGSSTNTLGAQVLAELNEALDQLDRNPPRGLVIASGKANGFIAGADVDEFGQLKDEAGALALVKRGWDAFERLAAVKYPTARADPRLLPGRRAGTGACVPLPRPRRRAGHAPGPARGHARDRAGLGRHEAAAAPCRRAGGARPDADRPHDRRAAGEAARHRRRDACPRGSWRTRCAAS